MPSAATVGNVRIRAYLQDTGQHSRPHFHAAGPDGEMVVGIPEMDVIAGSLPVASRRAVLSWAEEHRQLLVDAWSAANPGLPAHLPGAGGTGT